MVFSRGYQSRGQLGRASSPRTGIINHIARPAALQLAQKPVPPGPASLPTNELRSCRTGRTALDGIPRRDYNRAQAMRLAWLRSAVQSAEKAG